MPSRPSACRRCVGADVTRATVACGPSITATPAAEHIAERRPGAAPGRSGRTPHTTSLSRECAVPPGRDGRSSYASSTRAPCHQPRAECAPTEGPRTAHRRGVVRGRCGVSIRRAGHVPPPGAPPKRVQPAERPLAGRGLRGPQRSGGESTLRVTRFQPNP